MVRHYCLKTRPDPFMPEGRNQPTRRTPNTGCTPNNIPSPTTYSDSPPLSQGIGMDYCLHDSECNTLSRKIIIGSWRYVCAGCNRAFPASSTSSSVDYKLDCNLTHFRPDGASRTDYFSWSPPTQLTNDLGKIASLD